MSIVVNTHPLAEILVRKLLGIEVVPKAEQTKMVNRAIKATVEFYDKKLQRKDSAAKVLRKLEMFKETGDESYIDKAIDLLSRG